MAHAVASVIACLACLLRAQATKSIAENPPATAASQPSPDLSDAQWYPVQSVSGLVASSSKFSSGGCDCRLRVEVTPAPPKAITVSLRRADQSLFSFNAHDRTTFFVHGKCFCYADFRPDAPGGEIVAVDLATGREKWRSTLDSISAGASGSPCTNRIALDVWYEWHDNNWKAHIDRLEILREENGQRYLQLMDFDTGKTIGHHLYESQPKK